MANNQQSEELEVLESIYGTDWKKEIDSDSSYSIQVQPNVTLFVTLSSLYPSEAPPTYTLLAPTLNKKKKDLIAQTFEEIYGDCIGSPVLFQWIEKLKELTEVLNGSVEDLSVNNIEVKTVSPEDDDFDCNIIHGPTIQDRKSVFQGHVCKVYNETDVKNVIKVLLRNKKVAQATHNIFAYRIEKDDKISLQDFDDDGENHAGGRLLHLLQIMNVKNILVIVSRWYGGIQLGPDRFRHINNSARQVLEQSGYI